MAILNKLAFHYLLVGISSQKKASHLLKGPCTHVWLACEPPIPLLLTGRINQICDAASGSHWNLCKAAQFAELPDTQILPDLSRFQEVCQLLESEHSLDGWKLLYAWLERAAAWLTWRQNPAHHFHMSNIVAAPCTHLT